MKEPSKLCNLEKIDTTVIAHRTIGWFKKERNLLANFENETTFQFEWRIIERGFVIFEV